MCMIATEIHREEEVPGDIPTKEPTPGCDAQRRQSSTQEGSFAADEHGPHEELPIVATTTTDSYSKTVLKYAAEHVASRVPLSPGGKQGESSVVADQERVASAAVGEDAPCASKTTMLSKQRIQVVVRIRPIHPGSARYPHCKKVA